MTYGLREAAAKVFADHDAMGCCDPKTTEHVWQSLEPLLLTPSGHTEEWRANGLVALDHLDTLYHSGEPGGMTVGDYRATTDAIRAALSSPEATPAGVLDEGALREALERAARVLDHLADYEASGFSCVGCTESLYHDPLAVEARLARAALGRSGSGGGRG